MMYLREIVFHRENGNNSCSVVGSGAIRYHIRKIEVENSDREQVCKYWMLLVVSDRMSIPFGGAKLLLFWFPSIES